MTPLPATVPPVRNRALRRAYFWMCAGVLCAYMSVTVVGLFRIWYVAAGLTGALAILLVSAHTLRARGMGRSLVFVAAYFLWLLLTALWAQYPQTTIWYAGTQSIEVAVFAMFYLLGMNFDLEDLTDFFVALVPAAIAIFVITCLTNPLATRFGGYAQGVLPFGMIFCLRRLVTTWRLRYSVLFGAAVLALIIGMSRAPLLVAGIGAILTVGVTARGTRSYVRLFAASMVMAAALAVTFVASRPLQLYAAKMVVRIIQRDISVAGEVIRKEQKRDLTRSDLVDDALHLLPEHFIAGMGYMNFMPWYGDVHHYGYKTAAGREVHGISLHNSFETWLIEGGLPCTLIVLFLLLNYFRILRRRVRLSHTPDEAASYRVYGVVMVCMLVMAQFHQVHTSPLLYAFWGIVHAFNYTDPRRSFTGALPAVRSSWRLPSLAHTRMQCALNT